jgi:hypothetical protein
MEHLLRAGQHEHQGNRSGPRDLDFAATDVEGRVEAAIRRGKDIVKKQVQIDEDSLKSGIDSL